MPNENDNMDKLDTILKTVISIENRTATIETTMATQASLDILKTEHGDQLEAIAKNVKKLVDEKPFQDKRISRVEFRTEKLLGKKLTTTDADFEEKYQGEQQLAKQETGG